MLIYLIHARQQNPTITLTGYRFVFVHHLTFGENACAESKEQ